MISQNIMLLFEILYPNVFVWFENPKDSYQILEKGEQDKENRGIKDT